MRECVEVVLKRESETRSWGFRLIGGMDEGLVLKIDKVLGLGTPASNAGLKAGDVLVQVESKLVTMLTHPEAVQCIREVRGLTLSLRVQRGDHIVPNIAECFPAKGGINQEQTTKDEDQDYYAEAMARGLGSRLQQPMFTTCGKIKVKVPKYNNPRDLYGDAIMEEMISGSSVDPSKLDPDSEAYKKRSAMKSFDPKRSSVLLMLKEQEIRGFEQSSVQDLGSEVGRGY